MKSCGPPGIEFETNALDGVIYLHYFHSFIALFIVCYIL